MPQVATNMKDAALADELLANLEKPGVVHDPDLVAELELMGIPSGSYDVRPLDGLRRLVARRMTDSARDIPHFSLNTTIEVDALLALRTQFNSEQEVRISVNDLIIKAAALTLERCAAVNASYTAKGIVLHKTADVAFAVAMDGGLVTPIIRDAGGKTVAAISQEAKDLAARGRVKRLKPGEYTGGTFTVSNLGMFGVDSFGSIINPPQACILSVGATRQAYVPGDTGPRAASLMTFTLTCDHRVVDGAIGAGWLKEFRAIIETPGILVA